MPEANDTSNAPIEVRLVDTKNPEKEKEYYEWLAMKLKDMPDMWEDRMKLDPVITFINIFAHPDNFVVDVGPREGVLAFAKAPPGYRAFLYGAMWGDRAHGIHKERHTVAAAAMEALKINSIEGITRADNILARKAMEKGGMRFKCAFKGGLWYNGVECDGVYYALTREDLGLSPLEEII